MRKIPVRKIPGADHQLTSSERFKIRTIQEILGGNNLKQDLHRHDFFFVLLLEKGGGNHEIDFVTYGIKDQSVFLLRPGQVHQLELNKDCTGYLMEFNYEFYHPKNKTSAQRFRRASSTNFCKLELQRFEALQNTFTHIYKEYNNKEEGYLEIIKASLEIFFIELLRQSSKSTNESRSINSYTQERLEEFLELLEKHANRFKQVSQYTALMSLSAYQLNEITKATLGKTPSDLINEQIILEAKRYLLATPNQVKDIADLLGYEDVSYFIRLFKKHTRYSPDSFRQAF